MLMRRRHLVTLLAFVALGCDPSRGARVHLDSEGDQRHHIQPDASRVKVDAKLPLWFALYYQGRGMASIVSIRANRHVLLVEATSPNLEIASIVDTTRGQLDGPTIQMLFEALAYLAESPSEVLAARAPVERIEGRGLFADIGTCEPSDSKAWRGLSLDALPESVSDSLLKTVAAASRLPSHFPLSVLRAVRVDTGRVKRIREDDRKLYSIVPVGEAALASARALSSALECPGLVISTGEEEARMLQTWRRTSNPRSLGQTLFIQVESGPLRGVFQLHLHEVSAVDERSQQ